MVSSFRFALCSLLLCSFDVQSVTIFNHVRRLQCPSRNRTCRFPTSGSSADLTDEAGAPFAVRAVVGGVRYSVQCPSHAPSSLCVLLPTPSSGPTARTGNYPDYTSNMSWSDCHTAIPPPCLLPACWRLPEGAVRLSQVPMQTVGLPATDSDPGPA